MKELFLTLLIGTVAGVIDVLPMIKMKLDNYAKASAFFHYLIAPFSHHAISGFLAWRGG